MRGKESLTELLADDLQLCLGELRLPQNLRQGDISFYTVYDLKFPNIDKELTRKQKNGWMTSANNISPGTWTFPLGK